MGNDYTNTLKELLKEHGLGYFVRTSGWPDLDPELCTPDVSTHHIGTNYWAILTGKEARFSLDRPNFLHPDISKLRSELNRHYEGLCIYIEKESIRPTLERFAAVYKERFGKEIPIRPPKPKGGEVSLDKIVDKKGTSSIVETEGTLSIKD